MGLRSARTSYFLMYELNEPQRRWHASLPCTYRRMTMAAQSCCNHFDRYLVGVITVLSKFSFALKTICQLMVMWHLWGSVPNNSTFSHIWRFFFFRCFVTHFTFWNVKKKKVDFSYILFSCEAQHIVHSFCIKWKHNYFSGKILSSVPHYSLKTTTTKRKTARPTSGNVIWLSTQWLARDTTNTQVCVQVLGSTTTYVGKHL